MLSNKNVRDRPNAKKYKSHFFSSPCFSETCESWMIILYLPPCKQSVWVWALILSATAKQCCNMSETDQKKDPITKFVGRAFAFCYDRSFQGCKKNPHLFSYNYYLWNQTSMEYVPPAGSPWSVPAPCTSPSSPSTSRPAPSVLPAVSCLHFRNILTSQMVGPRMISSTSGRTKELSSSQVTFYKISCQRFQYNLAFAGNLSLPGGFKMANSSNKYCDVATATGRANTQIQRSINSVYLKQWLQHGHSHKSDEMQLQIPAARPLIPSYNTSASCALSKEIVGINQAPPGTYSCLQVDLVFARELSFYILTIYIPCFMIEWSLGSHSSLTTKRWVFISSNLLTFCQFLQDRPE